MSMSWLFQLEKWTAASYPYQVGTTMFLELYWHLDCILSSLTQAATLGECKFYGDVD